MHWYIDVLKKYSDFKGRSRRKEYWFFVLFNMLIAIGLGIIDGVIGTNGILGIIYSLAIILPAVAVSIRRLHDISKSGWWLLIAFIPLIGALVLLIFMVMDSKPEENQWGASPKASEA